MRLLLLADTHVPARARDLPPEVWAAVDEANVVIHAGDWVAVDLLDRLEARAEILIGVHGNNDGPELRSRLPEVQRFGLPGLQVALVHETGPRAGREARADARFPLDDLIIFGHSHIPWDTVTPAGKRMLNPGSPTDRRSQPACTYLTATVTDDDGLSDVTLHALPVRAS